MQKTAIATFAPTANAEKVLEARYYRGEDKDFNDMCRRVAVAVAAAEKNKAARSSWSKEFYQIMADGLFFPNSPTLMNAGRPLGQLSACFVLPVPDSMEGIFEAVKNTALIHKSGGGTGFSFSRLRQKDAIVHATKGKSSGPLSFMEVFNTATESIKQGGARRGANMGLLRVDHPDILAFISCKDDVLKFNNFNISVGITDAFMKALEINGTYSLIEPHTGKVVGELDAAEVWQQIVDHGWLTGEPGVIFVDSMERYNPTPNIGEFESTNPCGEQPLLPYESCNLGSINVAKFVKMVSGHKVIDYDKLKAVVRTAVRFLDNVIEVNKYPIPEIDAMTRANRKIGLGIMGWADLLIEMGIPYDSTDALQTANQLMESINFVGHEASYELAKERGSFPNFKGSVFENRGAMRNATVTTIAPTGTISIIANASSSVEPLFALAFQRNQAGHIMYEVNPAFEAVAKERGFWSDALLEKISNDGGSCAHCDEVPADVKTVFRTAHDISPEYHVKMQAAFQEFVDNAVSKTVNFPNDATKEDVDKVFRMAYATGCKGITIYRDGSRSEQVLSTGATEKKEVAVVQEAVVAAPSVMRDRPAKLKGVTLQMQTGCGPLYITVNEDENGKPFELFTTMGKAGGCAASQSEAIGRMVSLAWRSGVSAGAVIKQLQGISCHCPCGFGENKVLSCADAVGKAISAYMADKTGDDEFVIKKQAQHQGGCPDCGSAMEHAGGCIVCHSCGYSAC